MLNRKSLCLTILLTLSSALFTQTTLAATTAVTPPEVCAPINEKAVAALFTRWNNSLKSLDPDQVVANYAHDGVLLPTLSNTPRTSHAEMRDYFVTFLKKSPQGHIDQRIIRFGCDWATDTGLYTFTLHVDGDVHKVQARYSYVYEYIDGKWLIVHHHSSLMPEKKGQDEV